MPKLTTLSQGSTVRIPIFGSDVDFIFIGSNHYGKSEADLFMKFSKSIPLRLSSSTIPGAGSTQNYFVDSSWPTSLEMYFCYLMQVGMPSVIRSSLVETTVVGAGIESLTMSMFQPSSTEVGVTSVELRQTYAGDTEHRLVGRGSAVGSNGSLFSYFNTTSGKQNRPSWVRNVITYKSVTSPSDWNFGELSADNSRIPSEEFNGVPVFYVTTGYGVDALITNVSSKIGYTNNYPGSVQPIMLLNGNVEVTAKTGSSTTEGTYTYYDISKAAAIETYRKIDGVWYRTI